MKGKKLRACIMTDAFALYAAAIESACFACYA